MDSTPFAGIRVNVVAVLRLTSSVASQVPSGCCAACTVSSGGGPPTVTLTLSPSAKAEFFGFGVIESCTCFIEPRSHRSETASQSGSDWIGSLIFWNLLWNLGGYHIISTRSSSRKPLQPREIEIALGNLGTSLVRAG